VLGGLVGGRRDDRDAALPRVVDRVAGERGLVQRAERLLDDLDVVVDGVGDRHGEAVDVGDERRADAHVDLHAVRARAELAAVVGLGAGVARLAGAVAVLDVVVGVVVVVEEVPADEVVDVAVAVAVGAVGEGDEHVLRIEHRLADAVLAVLLGERRPHALRRSGSTRWSHA
jgi:hypothetical protein